MIISAQKELLTPPTRSCHASCIARAHGETWLTWFGGTEEGARDVKIYVSRRADKKWSEPIRICADEQLPHWNPVLMPTENGADLFFKVGLTIPDWYTMRVHLSKKGQPTSAPHELAAGDRGGRGPVRNKCLKLMDGRLLAPASLEFEKPTTWRDTLCAEQLTHSIFPDDPIRWKPFVDISEDGGETFHHIAPIPLLRACESSAAEQMPPASVLFVNAHPLQPCHIRKLGAIQPTLWQTKDGRVHLLMRSSEGCVLRSDSPDGIHWSPACRTDLPNNNSGIDLVRIADGRILLCLNPIVGNWAARTPLWLYLSQDEGDTFSPLIALEVETGEYSYPSLTAEGNTVYLSYTYKREAIAVWTIELSELHP